VAGIFRYRKALGGDNVHIDFDVAIHCRCRLRCAGRRSSHAGCSSSRRSCVRKRPR